MGHTLIFPLSSLRTALHHVHAARRDAGPLVPRFLRTSLITLLVAISYYAATTLGLFLKPAHTSMATFWPPSAILLAALLLARTRMWWIFLSAVLPAHLLAQLQTGGTVPDALGWFLGNAGGALIGAVCIRHFMSGRPLFDSERGFVIFLIFGVLVAPVLKSLLDAAVTLLVGRGAHYWTSWATRLTANIVSYLIIVPTIVIFAAKGTSLIRKVNLARFFEAGVLAGAIVTVSLLVFSGETNAGGIPAIIYAPLPFLLWAAVRFGPGGLSVSMLVVALISIWNALHGRGSFGNLSVANHVFSLHILLIIFALPSMLTATLIVERRRRDEWLRDTRSKLVNAHEQERYRIARELHDGIVQQLTLVGLRVDELRSGSDPPTKPALGEIYDQISIVSNATRDLSHDLHPFILEYLGLARALEKLCRDTGAKSGLTISFSKQDVPSRLPADISHCLFRIAQEALQNIVRHSHAGAASMELKVRQGHAFLRIVDDGIGVTPEQCHAGGMGIASMRERAWALDGTCKITAGALKGTTVEASVPLKQDPQAHSNA
jgi:signal transduction histidine kinase